MLLAVIAAALIAFFSLGVLVGLCVSAPELPEVQHPQPSPLRVIYDEPVPQLPNTDRVVFRPVPRVFDQDAS